MNILNPMSIKTLLLTIFSIYAMCTDTNMINYKTAVNKITEKGGIPIETYINQMGWGTNI